MNVPVTRAAEGFARRAFTVAEILRMVEAGIIAEDENFELIEGEIVPMSPKGNQHEVLKSALTRILAKHAPDDLRLGVETSVYLDKHSFVEPDLCLYPKRLLPEDVKGRDILLAIEVAGRGWVMTAA
jgi:Uma2 family endonuclease